MAPGPRRDYSSREFFSPPREESPEHHRPDRSGTPDTVVLDDDNTNLSIVPEHPDDVTVNGDAKSFVRSSEDLPEPVFERESLSESDRRPPVPVGVSRKTTATASIRSGSVVTRDAGSDSSSSRLPEFFSQATFQTALVSPTISHQLQKFAEARLAGESMEFLLRANQYSALLDAVNKSIAGMHKDFISNSAQRQINIDDATLAKTNLETRAAMSKALPMLESVFSTARTDVERLMYTDIYPNLRQASDEHQRRASAGNRSQQVRRVGRLLCTYRWVAMWD